jgi:hypothetical protein
MNDSAIKGKLCSEPLRVTTILSRPKFESSNEGPEEQITRLDFQLVTSDLIRIPRFSSR